MSSGKLIFKYFFMRLEKREMREIKELLFGFGEFFYVLFAMFSILWFIAVLCVFIFNLIDIVIVGVLFRSSIIVLLFGLLHIKITK